MGHDLCSDFHQLLPQGGQRPVLYLLGQRQPTEKVAQIISQSEQLQANLIVHKVVTGKSSPVQGVFAFLDPLFGCATLIIKAHHILGFPAEGVSNLWGVSISDPMPPDASFFPGFDRGGGRKAAKKCSSIVFRKFLDYAEYQNIGWHAQAITITGIARLSMDSLEFI